MTNVMPMVDGIVYGLEYFTLRDGRQFARDALANGADEVALYHYNTRTGEIGDDALESYDRNDYYLGLI